MKLVKFSMLFLMIGILQACIGDDFIEDRVDREIRVLNLVDTLILGETYAFDVRYLNEIGQEETVSLNFSSSNPDVVSINQSGEATALQLGMSTIDITYEIDGEEVSNSFDVTVGEDRTEQSASRKGTIVTTTFYDLEGSYTIEPDGENLILTLEEDFRTTDRLPGLYVYLTNNRNSVAGAHLIGMVTQFEGKHSYEISGVELNEHEFLLFWCKPFSVKVGEGFDDE